MAYQSPVKSEADPRFGNTARERLTEIIDSLVLPPNYRVVLTVDRVTERLVLTVQRRKTWKLHIWGRPVWTSAQPWDNPETILRKLEARSYEGIIALLEAAPEFLEFEIAVEGLLQYRNV